MKAILALRMAVTLLIALSIAALPLHAQTSVNWNGGNGNWTTASDWSGGVVPNNGGGKTYNVTISNGTAETVTLDLGVTISDLTLGTSAILQSSGNNSLTIAGGGTFTNSGTLTFNTGTNVLTIQGGGTLNNSGTITISGAGSGLNVTGTTTNNSGATISVEGGSTSTFTGSVNNSGTFETGFSGGSNTVTVTGTFTNNSGGLLELASSGDVVNIKSLSNSGTLTLMTGTTLTLTGGGNGVTDVVAGSTYNIGGAFNVKNGGTTTSALAKLTSVEGTLTLSNGQTNSMAPSGGTLTISNTGNVTVEGATTLFLIGNVNNSGTFTTGFSGGNNTVTVSGTFTNNAGAQVNLDSSGDVLNVNALSNSGNINIVSGTTLNITGGGSGVTDVVAGSTYTVTGNFNVKNGNTTTSALAKLTSIEGNLTVNNTQSNAITPNGGTLTISNTGQFSIEGGTKLSLTGNVNNSGTFTSGFSGPNNTINVSGTFTNNSGAQLNLDGAGDVVNFNALSNSGTVTIASGSTLNITGGGQGITDVVGGSIIQIQGNFNVINGGKPTFALGSLTSVEGLVDLNNNQANSVTPNGGTLTLSSTGQLNLSDGVATVTSLSITGNVNNSGIVSTGFSGGTNTVNVSGTFTNGTTGQLNLYGAADVVNIVTLSNAGAINFQNAGAILDITGAGTLTNSGNILLTAGNLKFSASSATLTGGGTVTLGNSNGTENFTIVVGSGTGTLTNVNNTITGFGNFGGGNLTIVNQGTVNANGGGIASQPPLRVQPGSGGVTNTGTLEATNEGILILQGTFNNNKGTIEALGYSGGTASSTVELVAGTVINGGTLTTTAAGSNTGIIENVGSVTLNGITNGGLYDDTAGTTTTLMGTVTNSGSISLSGSTLTIGNSVTLNGKGAIVLSNSAANLINAATSGLTLTTANTIEGAGTIQGMGIVNTGTIAANQSTPLILLPSPAGLNNKGTLSVSTGDTMQIGTSAGGALKNFSGTTLTGGTYSVAGTMQFGASGTSLVTNDANITLTGAGAQIIDFGGHSILTNFATNNAGASFALAGGANFTTAGNFTNNGTLTAGAGSTFKVTGSLTNYNGSTKTLTGGSYTVGGKLSFAGANIVTDAANITLQGTGEIVNSTNNSNGLANLATITAAGSFSLANKAKFTTAGNLTDNGRLTDGAGSTLTVNGNLTNLSGGTLGSGTYTIGGTLQLAGSNGGITSNAANFTLTGTGFKILDGTSNALSTFANNSGTFTLTGNGSFTTGGAFTNTGTANVTAGSTLTVVTGSTYIQSAGTTTVDGTLTASSGINVTGGTILGAGKLGGNVTVGGGGSAPTISVGDAGKAGLLAITSSYTQLSTGSLNIFVGGTTVGTQYSQLQVGGTASLGGTLSVTLANGFVPTIGSTFLVVSAGSISGTFSNTTIAINSTEHFAISYTSTGVVLSVVSGPASNSSSSATSNLVAALQPKPHGIARSGLRRASVADKRSGPVRVAGLRYGGARPHAVPAEGRAWQGLGSSTLVGTLRAQPVRVFAGWERSVPAAPIARLPQGVARVTSVASQIHNWAGTLVGGSSLRIPARGTLLRNVPPARILPQLPVHLQR